MKPTDSLAMLFSHNLWANLQLLNFCSALSREQMAASIPGAYGSIQDTLQHIVNGEQLYFSLISTGERYDYPEEAAPMTLAEMSAAVRITGKGLIEWAPKVQSGDMIQPDGSGTFYCMPTTVLLTQAINHATEHRAQVMAILTQLGIQPPELDGWTYFHELEKSDLLEGLMAEYRDWEALLDAIGPERMELPGVSGHWSVKDIVAHLSGWRERTVARLQAAGNRQAGPPPPWPSHLRTDGEINAWIYAANHGKSVGEVLDESQQIFQQLLAAIQALPEVVVQNPAGYLAWWEGQSSIQAGDFFAHFHEEHEPDMRAWLGKIG